MTSTTTSNKAEEKRPWWRRLAAFFFLWTYRIVGTATILLGLLVLFSTTEVFRVWFRDFAIEKLNDVLEAKVDVDDIRIDLFHGLVIERPRLHADGTLLLDAERIEVAYDLASLFRRVATINRVEIVRPHVNLIRSEAGVWNFSRITKPSTDTTTSEFPEGTFLLLTLRLSDGTIEVDDRSTPRGDSSYLDPTHIRLEDVQLDLSARADLADHDVAVAINGLSFKQANGPLDVRRLSMVARATRLGVDIESLRLSMDRTEIAARLSMSDVDVFDDFSDTTLANHPLQGFVKAEKLWGPDLNYVVPQVDLKGSYRLAAFATFSGVALDVSDFALSFSDARVYGSCKFTELDKEQPYVDINIHNSVARYADVRQRLAFVPLPELPFLTRTTIEHVHLTGHPQDSLVFTVRGSDRPGKVDGLMKLYLREERLGYVVDMGIEGGDLSAFNDDPEYSTMLNGRVMMVGKGVTLQDQEGTTQIELDRSRLFGRPVRRFRAMIQGDGQGTLTVDTLFADITPFRVDTLISEEELVYESESTGTQRLIGLSGMVNAADPSRPMYDVNISSYAVNMAELFYNDALPDHLSFEVHARGEGIELDSIVGDLNGKVTMLALQDRALLPFDLSVVSSRADGSRKLHVDSDFGHIHVDGTYEPSSLIEALTLTSEVVVQVITKRLKDIVRPESDVTAASRLVPQFTADIDIDLDDASLINLFLNDAVVSGLARVDALVDCDRDNIMFKLDSLYVRDFMVETADASIYADPTSAAGSMRISNVSSQPSIDALDIDGWCDSVLVVNGTRLSNARVGLHHHDNVTRISAESGVDDMSFRVAAAMQQLDDLTRIQLDTAEFTLNAERKLSWFLMEPSTISIADESYSTDMVKIQRRDAEIIKASGTVSAASFDNVRAEISGFPLSHLPRFTDLPEKSPLHLITGYLREGVVTVNGSWEEPEIGMDLTVDDVAYNRALIGNLKAHLEHKDRTVVGSAVIDRWNGDENVRTLTLDVKEFPIDVGFTNVQERLVPDRNVDMDLTASKLALAAIEPFLPAVESVRGYADAQLHVGGRTLNDIIMTGSGNVYQGRFLSSATNMIYSAAGTLRFDRQTLYIDSLLVRNDSRDLKNGVALAKGAVIFDGLAVDSIDFTVKTPTSTGLQVLSKASQARSPLMYGDLVIMSGNNPIHLYGKLNKPYIKGDLIVRYSQLTFPKERSTTKVRKNTFVYTRDDPTSYERESIFDYVNGRTPMRYYDTTAVEDTTDAIDPQLLAAEAIKDVARENAAEFVDVLEFDLNIFLKGRTLLTMNLGALERLEADLEQVDSKVPLRMTGRFGDDSFDMKGLVRVKEGVSTYQFYKPFKTSGVLNFNTGGLTNPSLNLKATWEDRRYKSDGTDNPVKVEMTITGTKEKPNISFRYWLKNREQTGDSAKIAADALMLILVGQTQEELVQSGQSNLVNQLNSAFSAAATSALSDIVSGIGVIQSFQLDIGSDLSDSRVTVSGQVFGDVTYSVSGQISDFSGSSTFTLSMPLSVLSDAEAMRLLRADFSHTVNSSGNVTRQMRLWEIKLGARLP